MEFKEAMDAVGIPAGELAKRLGVSAQAIYQARLDPDNPGKRPPPKGWERELAAIARERCPDLKRVAELDRANGDPGGPCTM